MERFVWFLTLKNYFENQNFEKLISLFIILTKTLLKTDQPFIVEYFFSKFVASLFWCYYTTTAALAVLYSGPAVSTIILERFLNAKCQFVIYHNFFVEQTAAQLNEIISGGECKFFVSKRSAIRLQLVCQKLVHFRFVR